jgi:type IV secretion system protein VirB9
LTFTRKYNQRYKISGTQRISPIRIFDDGEFTYFQFKDINADIPAFFRVDSEGKEAIVNYRTVGDYVVVERVTSQFTLRDGRDIVCVFNEASPLELVPKDERSDANWFQRNF